MQRTLVVYYSRSGHTRAVAQRIIEALGADFEQIADLDNRHGPIGWLGCLREAIWKRPAKIGAIRKDPALYELVVLGTPVWAGTISSPMRAYLAAHGAEAKRVALFCTLGGSGADKALAEMEALCSAKPLATMAVTQADFRSGAHAARIGAFLEALGGPAAQQRPPTAVPFKAA